MLRMWDEEENFCSYEHEVLTRLPQVIREELCLHAYGNLLKNVPFLSWIRGYNVCLRRLASLLDSRQCEEGDYLFRAGQPNEVVFILDEGKLWLSLTDSFSEEKSTENAALNRALYIVSKFLRAMSEKMTVSQGADLESITELSLSHAATLKVTPWNKLPDGRRKKLLEGAASNLEANDRMVTGAVIAMQRGWRAKKRRENNKEIAGRAWNSKDSSFQKMQSKDNANVPKAMYSHSINGPAYLGESCLWVPFANWATEPVPRHTYNARCEQRCKVVCLPRAAFAVVLQEFSPWLPRRFEFFRQLVIKKIESHMTNEAAEAIMMDEDEQEEFQEPCHAARFSAASTAQEAHTSNLNAPSDDEITP